MGTGMEFPWKGRNGEVRRGRRWGREWNSLGRDGTEREERTEMGAGMEFPWKRLNGEGGEDGDGGGNKIPAEGTERCWGLIWCLVA
ncbi:MAG: hypothetical protein IKN77_06275 [Paludibacteraceae bacterium]|nr:hypothetical protein [Paludibacteraceae bacterium]